jgi:GntR family transcriptional regulator
MTAGPADEQEANDLGIEPGTPVLRGRHWFYDVDGDVIEYGESVSVAGRWASYEYQVSND